MTLDPKELVRSRLPIEDLVSESVALKREGALLRGLCPFHSEKTPSFVVTPERGTYRCFGCEAGGDIFSWVMQRQGLEFPEALRLLAARAKVELPDGRFDAGAHARLTLLADLHASAALFYQGVLAGPAGAAARRYLEKRGFGAEVCAQFGVGFAAGGWTNLLDHLTGGGARAEDALEAGLVCRHAVKGTLYDRFRLRVMIPIRDTHGRIVGFVGRALEGAPPPKYLNSPRTPLFDKGKMLFGLDQARLSIQRGREAVLVEGYLDVLRAHQAGCPNVVASQGTAVTVDQLVTLARLAPRLVIALDADPAGTKAAARAGLLAMQALKDRPDGPPDLRIVTLPAGQDPDLVIRDGGAEQWTGLVREAPALLDYYFHLVAAEHDPARFDYKQKLIDALLPVIRDIPGVGIQQHYLDVLAEMTGIGVDVLQAQMLGKTGRATPGTAPPGARPGTTVQHEAMRRARALLTNQPAPLDALEEALLGLLLVHQDNLSDAVLAVVGGLELSSPERQALFGRLLAGAGLGDDLQSERQAALAARIAALTLTLPPVKTADLVRTMEVYVARHDQLTQQAALARTTEAVRGLATVDEAHPLIARATTEVAEAGRTRAALTAQQDTYRRGGNAAVGQPAHYDTHTPF